eukprot:3172327-Prymnesium_polylepis.1
MSIVLPSFIALLPRRCTIDCPRRPPSGSRPSRTPPSLSNTYSHRARISGLSSSTGRYAYLTANLSPIDTTSIVGSSVRTKPHCSMRCASVHRVLCHSTSANPLWGMLVAIAFSVPSTAANSSSDITTILQRRKSSWLTAGRPACTAGSTSSQNSEARVGFLQGVAMPPAWTAGLVTGSPSVFLIQTCEFGDG